MVIECFRFIFPDIGIVIRLSSLTNAVLACLYAVFVIHEALFNTEEILCCFTCQALVGDVWGLYVYTRAGMP